MSVFSCFTSLRFTSFLTSVQSASNLPFLYSVHIFSTNTPTLRWTVIYPIYLDASRPLRTGARRLSRPKSLWHPLSKDIADAAARLGLPALHEVQKAHPADWANPGRVRVQWRRDGRLVNAAITTSTSPSSFDITMDN